MVIYNNLAAMSALNETNRNTSKLSKALAKASSGMKINDAGDDASAYAISEKMRVQIRSLDQDIENTKTGRNLVATAEGGIQNIVENLRYLKEKAIDAANDHNTDADRAFIQKEVNQRLDEINDIASTTHYNGRILLNGDYKRPEVVKTTPGAVVSVGSGAKATKNTLNNLLGGFTVAPSPITNSGVTGPTTNTQMKYHNVLGTVTYYGKIDSVNITTSLKVDFSGATKPDGSAPSYPSDFDGQGFSMGCANCYAYSSVRFDASIPAGASSVTVYYKDKPLTNPSIVGKKDCNELSYEYVIGIQGVTDSNSMAKAFYNGMVTANAKENAMVSGVDVTTNDANGDAYFGMKVMPERYDGIGNAHQLRIAYVNGEVYLQRSTPNAWVIYGDGAITNGDGGTVTETAGEFKRSLIIHTGTKSNENIHVFINDMHARSMGIESLEVDPREKAEAAIDRIDAAIDYALSEATYMGAYQSRLSETEGTLVTNSENTTSAESVIRDTDMAKTMMDYAKFNILQQSSQSMLAQANQNPQNILSLMQ